MSLTGIDVAKIVTMGGAFKAVGADPDEPKFAEALKRMGANITEQAQDVAGEPIGDIIVEGAQLQGTETVKAKKRYSE